MLNIIFNSNLRKKQYDKLKVSSLNNDQINKLYLSFDNMNKKIKYLSENEINDQLQELIFNDSSMNINDKINLLKNKDNNPFTKLTEDEIVEIIQRDDINLSSIVSLVIMNNAYEKLDLLKEKNNVIENDTLVKNNYSDFEKVLNKLLINDDKNINNKFNENLSDLLLKKDIDNKYIYEKVLSNSKLQELLFNNIIKEFPYIGGDSVNLRKNKEDLSSEELIFYDKLLTNENFKKVFFTDDVLNKSINSNLIFNYLPKDKRYYLGLYSEPMKHDVSSEVAKNEYKEDLKEKYSKYYSDLDQDTVDFLINNQSSSINNNNNKEVICTLLKQNELDSKFINKCLMIINKINYFASDYKDMLKKVIDLNKKYPDVLDYIYYTSSISPDFYEKIKYLINNPKLENINGVEQINDNSLEKLKTFSFDLDNESKDKLNVFFEGGNLNQSLSGQGNHGIFVIREDGTTINRIGPYHEGCLNFMYSDETNNILNEYQNIEYGLSVGDSIILYENNNNLLFLNSVITDKQKDSLFGLVNNSSIKDKLNFNVQIKQGDEYKELNNGNYIGSESLIESINHLKTKTMEESLDNIGMAV